MITIKSSWDDGCEEDMRLAELLNKYEIPGIFYIPSKWILHNHKEGRDALTTGQVMELDKAFEIGSHSINHPMLTRIPIEEAKREIVESKISLEQLLGHEVDSFCYPRGYANDELRDIVRTYYTNARNTLVGSLEAPEDPVWESTTVHVAGTRRPEYENTTWLHEGFRLLDEAISRSNDGEDIVYSMFGHSWEISRYDAWGDLEIFLKTIHELDIHGN